jgi:apolipoprotein N-acyltransferase
VALIPLLLAIWLTAGRARRPWVRGAQLGYLAGVLFFAGSLSWLAELAPLYGIIWMRGIPLLVALFLALYPALFGAFAAVFCEERDADQARRRWLRSSRNLGIAALTGAAWVSTEVLRENLFPHFGWNKLGVALHAELVLTQVADLVGVGGLSWLVAHLNAIGALTLRRFWHEFGLARLRAHWDFTLSVALVGGVVVYGGARLFSGPPAKGVGTTDLLVAVVQPNVPQQVRFHRENHPVIREKLKRLHEFATVLTPDLVLWPEAAIPGGIFADDEAFDFASGLAEAANAVLITGTEATNPGPGRDEATQRSPDAALWHNSVAMLDPRAKQVDVYDKQRLVPFGEYLPLRGFPPMEWIAGALIESDFAPGAGARVFRTAQPAMTYGPLICFEDTVAELARAQVRAGARLLVNVTNDGWFGTSAAAEQHLANARMRSVETARPMVRCGNTGYSVVIDRMGRVEQLVRPFVEGMNVRKVTVPPLPSQETLFVRWGAWWEGICCGVAAVAVTFSVSRRLRRRWVS